MSEADAMTAALTGTPVLVSPLLPRDPSPAEVARRIVRHGYAAARTETGRACFFPDTLGDVGPVPRARINAMWLGDRLMVSAALKERLQRDFAARGAVEAANRAHRYRQDARWNAILAGILVVLNIQLGGSSNRPHPVIRVRSERLDDRADQMTFRAHIAPELEEGRSVTYTVDDDELRKLVDPDTGHRDVELVRLVAVKLEPEVRRVLAELKVDEEQAGRPGL